MKTEAQKRAKAVYQQKVKQMRLEFYPTEADIYNFIQQQPNKQGYIKALIKADIKAKENKTMTTVNFFYETADNRAGTDIADQLVATIETPEEDFELYAENSDFTDEERETNEQNDTAAARRLVSLIADIKEQVDNLPISGYAFIFPDGTEYTK